MPTFGYVLWERRRASEKYLLGRIAKLHEPPFLTMRKERAVVIIAAIEERKKRQDKVFSTGRAIEALAVFSDEARRHSKHEIPGQIAESTPILSEAIPSYLARQVLSAYGWPLYRPFEVKI